MKNTKSKILENSRTFFTFCGFSTFVFFAVIILPFIFGIYLTFTNWDGISKNYSFASLSNYKYLLSDIDFWKSFLLTLGYVVYTVAFTNIIAFFLGYLLTSKMSGKYLLRALFFTPNLVGGIILGLIWNFIFSNIFTFIGKSYHIEIFASSWLGKPDMAFWALVLVSVWQYSGYMMVIYIAGFLNLSRDLLEAASIDGAYGITKLIKIIIPLMVPSFIVCTFLSLQRSFMVYDLNLSLTHGGPFGSTKLISMHVYEKAFLSQDYGVGQAEAFFLFFIVAVITVTQLYFSKKMEVEA